MLPFDGAISRFRDEAAPPALRDALEGIGKNDILAGDYPYAERMDRDEYEAELGALQHQLVRLQSDVKATGKRVVVVFEGRDAAGKGGTISRFRMNMNPRVCATVALGTPTERESGEWYFQRYIERLPSAGEIVLFDRSWYNRAVIEPVFGFCSETERVRFFQQVPQFEAMLTGDGIHLVKLWLNVSRAEQLRRFLKRERDPLKQWKLSRIDVDGLSKWDAYTDAIRQMFQFSHTPAGPWTVVRSDDKRRARIGAIRGVLSGLDYAGKDPRIAAPPDPGIVGGPEIWPHGDHA